MNSPFCWKSRSKQILNQSFKVLQKKYIAMDDDVDDEEDMSGSRKRREQHVKTARMENDFYNEEDSKYMQKKFGDVVMDKKEERDNDNEVFEIVSRLRQKALDELSGLDIRIRRWRDLTNINFTPRHPESISSQQGEHAIQQEISQQPHNINKMDNKSTAVKPSLECKISFKFQYHLITDRLKVTIVKVSDIYKSADANNDLMTSVEVCLMPGKMQKQATQICEGTPNPVFNSVKYFNGLRLDEICQMCFRLKVLGKDGIKGRVTTLGEVSVSLADFDILRETELEEFVDTRVGSRSGCVGTFRRRIFGRTY